jgi:rhodanese-related sulfurtransferase
VEAAVPRDARVVVYCSSGNRSALAADQMREMGYTNVASLAGGFRAWAESGGEIDG